MSFNRSSGGFSSPTQVVLNLIIINALIYFAQLTLTGMPPVSIATDLFALHHFRSEEFRLYQIITHMFMHGSFTHLLFNMFSLYMFGSIIERIWGPKRFLLFYLMCGLGAAIMQMGAYAYEFRIEDKSVMDIQSFLIYQNELRESYAVGASGAIMGIIVAFGYLFPNTEMMIIPIPIPVKAKWVVIGFIAIDLFSGIAGRPGDNVAHFAHLGGAITGFLIVYFQNRRDRSTFY